MNTSHPRFTRRAVSRGIAAAGLTGLVVRPRTFAQTPAAEGWEFTDFRDVTVSLPEMPTRVVAQTTSAASLWDFGIKVVGFYGPNDEESDRDFLQIGKMDVSTMTYLGDWGTLDTELLVATEPDIYVDLYRGGEFLWYLPDQATADQVEEISPTIGINANGVPFMDTLHEFERLAVALGADVEGPEIAEGKTNLTEAEATFKSAIAGKEGLKVLAISTDATGGAYLWNGNWLNDMQYLQSLGMTAVDVGVGDDMPTLQISMEQLGNYPADVYLLDDRESPDVLSGQPIWESMPAVKAGQVGTWYSSVLYSYRSLAEVLNLYAAVLAEAEPVV
ncbi:MAG: ABC transporter substrate-binding protein [Thermomicrobiales bacterium]|nr:ABC transporter substrate-binding protein [Thermomicrobiales bacterium]